MKKTKSMIYKPTEESKELFLVATNDGRLYSRQIVYIIRSLAKKYAKGIFDQEKAADAFYYAATAASDQYYKDFGYRFTVTDRYTAAVDMVTYYMENIENNDI